MTRWPASWAAVRVRISAAALLAAAESFRDGRFAAQRAAPGPDAPAPLACRSGSAAVTRPSLAWDGAGPPPASAPEPNATAIAVPAATTPAGITSFRLGNALASQRASTQASPYLR